MNKILCMLLVPCFIFASWNPLVRRDSRLDAFIMQISSRYGEPLPDGFYQQPMHREPVSQFIQFALDSLELSEGEREDANFLMSWYSGEKTILNRSNENSRITIGLNLVGDVQMGFSDSLSYGLKGIINPGMNGYIGGLSFGSEFSMLTETRNDTMWHVSRYEPFEGNPYNLFGRADSGQVRASDTFRGGASWKLGMSQWDFGVDHLKLGPTIRNPLMLNFDSSPAAFVRMNLAFPWLNYTHSAVKVQSLRDYNRVMMYHRFEVPLLHKHLTASFNEAVVYGSTPDSTTEAIVHKDPLDSQYYNQERTFEPVYLIPFMPFAFMEHFSGDRENKQISMDFALTLPQNFYWYFEFFLDDMSSPATLFSDDFGNKWAFSVGGEWMALVSGRNLSLSSEYSRIEPWVYTHFSSSSHSYQHFGSSIGSDMGPNSDLFWCEGALQLNQKNRFSLSFENQRWNHEQRGGSINHVFYSEALVREGAVYDKNDSLITPSPYVEDSKHKKFLEGNVQSDKIVTLNWNFLPFHLYDMNSRISYSSRNGFGFGLNGGFHF